MKNIKMLARQWADDNGLFGDLDMKWVYVSVYNKYNRPMFGWDRNKCSVVSALFNVFVTNHPFKVTVDS